MNIYKTLLEEHSKTQTIRIVNYIGGDKTRLEELMDCFFSYDLKISQRAAWCLSYAGIAFPENVKPYLGNMIELLNKDVHSAVKRNILRMLEFIPIPKKHNAKLINYCFKILNSRNEPISVKVFSMSVLAKISKQVPEIKNELQLIIENQFPFSGKGFKSRANKILKEITIT